MLVVSEGVHDVGMWQLMSTVDLLKHGIPDPSSVTLTHSQGAGLTPVKEKKDTIIEAGKEYMASPIFVHTKLRTQDITLQSSMQLKKALGRYFSSSTFMRSKDHQNPTEEKCCPAMTPSTQNNDLDSALPKLFLIPSKSRDDSPKPLYESYISALWRLRDQVLSMSSPSFSRTVSERDWLKNSAKIWEIIKTSPIIADYYRTLQSSGMFRR